MVVKLLHQMKSARIPRSANVQLNVRITRGNSDYLGCRMGYEREKRERERH
jgi:hypothetical protein